MGLIDFLKDNWAAVMAAPWVFVTLAVIIGGGGWAIGRFMYGERIETLKTRIENRDEKIADYERKLGGASPDEARDKIDALERRLQALEPRSLSQGQIEKIGAILVRHPGAIDIIKDMGSPQANRLHSQLEKVFGQSGWQVRSPAAMGVTRPNSGILLTTQSGDQTTENAKCVMDAFSAAGLSFDLRREPAPPPNAMGQVFSDLQILVTDL
ncbi:hypothetical protein [Mesorhizobium sp.]|uniref:hypothetical protein n=1 Tax=Mesorhizobium sp. TaxID=1871066 RepID=UPI000FE64507|nr:hypothetical protein [Mesorhizobium sp.]RWD69526.1 MAG: hypothetical protein EOS37_17885 [Mesorhizobium sp.]TIV59826.1 MAG: hypothetical protein E5V80_12220 [Mesorhizobium sp.]